MFKTVLRILGLACIGAGLAHTILGVSGDWIIGVSPASPVDPSLDSQNRFYGAAFMAYGFLLWRCSADLARFAPVFRILFGVMFAAGCARGLAVLAYGWPTPQIMVLGAIELATPLLWVWFERELRKNGRVA